MSSQDQDFEEQDQDQEGEKLRTGGEQRSGSCWIYMLLAALLVVALFYSAARIGGGGLKGMPGAGGFDAGAKAYALAQEVESYRTSHPDRRNYCIVALYLEDKQGTLTDGPSKVVLGAGPVETHCEQEALRWVKFGVFPSLQTANLRTVHIVLFSQVRVCKGCKPTFDGWQSDLQTVLQQQAASNAPTPSQATPQEATQPVSVTLSVFEIRYLSPSGFDPVVYPAGPSTQGPTKPGTTKPVPVQQQDINQVR